MLTRSASLLVTVALATSSPECAAAQSSVLTPGANVNEHTIAVGATGYDQRRLVMTSACVQACPWGELGDFVRGAMARRGYEILLCRNCNRDRGPRLVAGRDVPPALDADDLAIGIDERIDAPVDFGVTDSGRLGRAFRGEASYQGGPLLNLRLIARIEDPSYLLAAVRTGYPISNLADIAARKLPVRILADSWPSTISALAYYGLDRKSVEGWGGTVTSYATANDDTQFDVIIGSMASNAPNLESVAWSRFALRGQLDFVALPDSLLEALSRMPGMRRVTVAPGYLRGIELPIRTVGLSGEAVYARADMPNEIAYTLAQAIDDQRERLIWYTRPYSYDPRTVWRNEGVPLHPGAAHYYRAVGYLPRSGAPPATMGK